jgi:gluconolactonase
MTIEAFEKEFTALIDPAARAERLATGFRFTEGPVWDRAKRCLYFSDIPADTIYRYTDAGGAVVYRKPSHHSNGLTIDGQGRLLACEHQARRVTREGASGIETLAERYQGKRLNSPNDIIVARDGSLIFTDPHYGLMSNLGGPAKQELPFRGVYRLIPGAAEPTLLADDFEAPNGLALSADQRTLYVDDSERCHIRVFRVEDGWSLSGGRVCMELPRGPDGGVPDGMKLDERDNLYSTGPGGVWVISPAAIVLGRIHMPEVTANLNWGDDDGRALYMTASTGLYRLRCLARGPGLG